VLGAIQKKISDRILDKDCSEGQPRNDGGTIISSRSELEEMAKNLVADILVSVGQ
jgi:hypothetical protein